MIVRVLMAVDPPIPRRELSRLRGMAGVLVQALRTRQRLWQKVGRINTDIVVVSQTLLPDPPRSLLAALKDLPDVPAVVVLTDRTDPASHAKLVAAGCDAVLQQGLPHDSLQEVLIALVHRRRSLATREQRARPLEGEPRLADFSSESPVMQSLMATVRRVVNAQAPLLILGETGVGKEHLARAIHSESQHASGPFVAINCGALPEALLESELFGHEEGAFTGATRARRGHFELAHGGTLFLDEIGDVALHLQVKLLRALQDHAVLRVGGERPIPVDVRIMAATNRDLAGAVEDGTFRRDLFYRLGVVTLTVPPLRDRPGDVPTLIRRFIAQLQPHLRSEVRGITEGATRALAEYDWPGNIRELYNVMERTMLLCGSDVVTHLDLRDLLGERPLPRHRAPPPPEERDEPWELGEDWLRLPWREVRVLLLDRAERAYLEGLLATTGGRVGDTARLAGMRPRSLFDKMRHHGLRKERFRGAQA